MASVKTKSAPVAENPYASRLQDLLLDKNYNQQKQSLDSTTEEFSYELSLEAEFDSDSRVDKIELG